MAETNPLNENCFCGEHFTDYQKENMRKLVCQKNDLYFSDSKGNKYCVFHFPSVNKIEEFSKAYNQKIMFHNYSFYGTWFPFEIDFEEHIFEKYADFKWSIFNFATNFKKAKFNENCDFRCCKFIQRVSFDSAEFNSKIKIPISFYSASFNNVADFSNALFNYETEFSNSKFLKGYEYNESNEFLKHTTQTSFSKTIFSDVVKFDEVTFGNKNETSFDSVFFSEAQFFKSANFFKSEFYLQTHFTKTSFKENVNFRETLVRSTINFEEANFENIAKFSAKDASYTSWEKDCLNFKAVETNKPERISFQTIQLKPDSFENTDPRKFDFTDIEWKIKSFVWDWSRFKDFIFNNEEARRRKSNYTALEKVYKRFASYAEDNRDFVGASKFRYTAFDIQRVKNWYGRTPFSLHWWYKLSSRYGENWLWASIVLFLLLTIFTFYFSYTRFYVCPKNSDVKSQCSIRTLTNAEAVHQSLMTATLQNVEYRKTITQGQDLIILLIKFLTPIQLGLLFLAIRRKFMR